MESIYVSQKDMLEICQDGDKYFLRYPTFNITCPEAVSYTHLTLPTIA